MGINNVKCPQCGKEFKPTKNQVSQYKRGIKKHIFCSHKCSVEFYKGKPRWIKSDAPFTAKCAYCGKEFKLSKGQRGNIRRMGQKNVYCSRECYGLSRIGRLHTEQEKEKISLSRKGEKHPFYGKHQSEESNKKRSEAEKGEKNPRWIDDAPIVKCAYCGKEKRIMPYQYKASKTKIFYCNNTCRARYLEELMTGKNNPNWQGGISFEPYAPEFNEKLKEYIRERDNYTCQLCGSKTSKTSHGHNTFVVHHIDYNKQNNNTNNLITLCNRCNSKVNFNREYWKAYFQKIMADIERGDDLCI